MRMSAWLAVTYMLAAVDPCAPVGMVDCASPPVSARTRDFVCVFFMLGYTAGRAAVWLCTRPLPVSTEACVHWHTPAAASTCMLAVPAKHRNRRLLAC